MPLRSRSDRPFLRKNTLSDRQQSPEVDASRLSKADLIVGKRVNRSHID
jgi:hypothetical protein